VPYPFLNLNTASFLTEIFGLSFSKKKWVPVIFLTHKVGLGFSRPVVTQKSPPI
jgi:hypothetical protein